MSSSRLTRRLVPLALAVLCLGGALGCAGWSAFLTGGEKRPTLHFVRADLRELALDSVKLEAVFRVANPYSVDLDLAKVAYRLELEGKEIAAGAPAAGVKLAAGEESYLTFPATVKFTDLADGLALALAKKVVHWRAIGEVGVNTPVGVVTLPLSAEGRIDLPEIPKLTLEAPVVEALSVMGGRIAFPIKVENPNRFPLAAPHLRADVTIAGTEIGIGRTDSMTPVEAGGEQIVRLTVEFTFMEVGAGVARLISSGEVQLRVDGDVEIGGVTVPVALEKSTRFSRVEKKVGPSLF